MPIKVAKADGTTENFDSLKLRSSLHKAGASEEITVRIVDEISKGLYDGIPTEEIYRRAFALLRGHRRDTASHYSLKRAILEFGPSGFPFETYLAALFKAEGYTDVKTGQIIQGGCVEHEVDVSMKKDAKKFFVEAKFHNSPAIKSDLKVSLYVKARIDDLKAVMGGETIMGMIVTNTKFTTKAIQYATCEGLELMSWGYPRGHNLHTRIEAAKLYPVTALTSLSKTQKTALLTQKIVLCSELKDRTDALLAAGMAAKKIEQVLHEAALLCASGKELS
ncbi:restriction endonuclease [Patescibacteria group bacterium]|nr:restriction endonuclease [Patescibacteria group bacterium]